MNLLVSQRHKDRRQLLPSWDHYERGDMAREDNAMGAFTSASPRRRQARAGSQRPWSRRRASSTCCRCA